MMLCVFENVNAQCPAVINTQPAPQTTGIGCSVSFNVNATGDPTVTYQWQLNGVNIGGATASTYTIPSVNAGHAGNYTVIVTAGCGTPVTSAPAAVLTVNPALSPGSINTTGGNFCVGGNVNIGGTSSPYGPAAGGSPPYTYQWEESYQAGAGCSGTWTPAGGINNGTSYDPLAFASAGTYCYRRKVTDACNTISYSGIATFNVYADPVSQTINPSLVSPVCAGTNISATFSGGSGGIPGTTDIYEFSTNSGSTWSPYTPGNSISTTGLSGTNIIQIRTRREPPAGVNGCGTGAYITYSWTVNALPTITGTLSVCVGSTTTLTGSPTPAVVNPWVSSNTSIATVTTGGVVTGVAAGTSTITYTNNNGCQQTATVTVNPRPVPTLTGPASACVGSTANVYTTEVGMSNYVWGVSAGGTITAGGNATSNTVTVTWTTTGAKTITVNYTNANGCTAATATTYNVTVNANPTATITGTASFCIGGSTLLSAATSTAGSGSITGYQWNLAGSPIGGATSSTYTATAAGAYTVTVTNSNGCSTTSSITNVTINPLPTITGTLDVCVGSTRTLTGSPTAAAVNPWVSSNTSIATVTTGGVVTGVAAGTSTITYTNSNGCQQTATVTVNPRPVPTLTGPASACVGSTANVYTTEVGMSNYVWGVSAGGTITAGGNATSNTATVTWTTAGPRTITINYTNANGCTAATAATYNVTVNANPTVAVNSPLYCSNLPAPTITATPAPAGSYNYVWTVPAGAPNPGNVASFTATAVAGTYSVVITNPTTGCTANGSGTLSLGNPPVVTLNPVDVAGCKTGGSNTSVTFTATSTGGSPAPTAQWQVSADNITFTNVTTGTTSTTTASGVTTSSFTIDPIAQGDMGLYYRVAFTNACATVYSTGALLSFGSSINVVPGQNNFDVQFVACNSLVACATITYNSPNNTVGWVHTVLQIGPTAAGPWTDVSLEDSTVGPGLFSRTACIPFSSANNGWYLQWHTWNYSCASNYQYTLPVVIYTGTNVTAPNSCIGGGNVNFTYTGAPPGGTWSVNGGGNINPTSGQFTPVTAGCWSATYTTPLPNVCSGTKEFVVFPAAPVLTAPSNTCASAFSLPSVTPVTGFTVEYSLDGGSSWSTSPSIPTTPGCYSIQARYVTSAACGSIPAGTSAPAACAASNTVNVVIFPAAPTIAAPTNTCNAAFTLPTVTAITGFTVQYSINGGTYSAAPTIPTTAGCHTIIARYVLTSACGTIPANTPGTSTCATSNTVSVVIFPNAPVITAPANTCNAVFALPSVPAVSQFTVQYEIDGGGFTSSPTIPTTPGCHTITARYVLTANCGSTTAGTAGTAACSVSNTVSVVIFPTAPTITASANTCLSAFTLPVVAAVPGFDILYSIDGGAYTATPTIPTTAGCHTVSARYALSAACGATAAGATGTGACGVGATVSIVIFPNAPTITAPTNTCNAAFILPTVPAVTNFTVQYSIDGGVYTATPTVPTTAACHTITARYVLTTVCGTTAAGTPGTGSCAASNTVSVVIFPAAPVLATPANTCASSFTLPTVTAVTGFNVEYNIDGGGFTSSPTIPGGTGCHTIQARYVLAADCGATLAGTAGTGSCIASNTVSAVIFPDAPVITAPANTCNAAFILPTVAAVPGFTVQYSIDGGTYSATPTIPTAAGCHTIVARFVLTSACGTTPANTPGTGTCASSNIVSVVIFPNAPIITAPTNACNAAFSLPTVTAIAGFTVEYSINGGTYSSSPTIPTTAGCHTISVRYALTSACGATTAGSTGTGSCGISNTVSVVIFPASPILTAPANTCNAAFSLPTVTPATNFDVQYSIDGGAYSVTPTIPTIPGCHTIQARYVLSAVCGTSGAGTSGTGACTASNTVNVVIYPAAPILVQLSNTCNTKLADITAVPAISGFTAEYAVQAPGGTLSAYNNNINQVNNLLTNTPGCWTIKARYRLTNTCGSTPAGSVSTDLLCQEVTMNAVVFPIAPTLTAPANTCNTAFTLPIVTAVAGFNVEYSIDAGAYSTTPTVPSTTGCHTVQARYVLAADCGITTAGSTGTGACAASNTVSVVIFPAAPVITSPANTCNTAFSLPTVTVVPGFTVQYSIDGGVYSAAPTIPSTGGCHSITVRYVLTAACGSTAINTAGAGACGVSNTVNVVIFPNAPTITAPFNTCNAAFILPTVAAVSNFTVQYSMDGGTYTATPTIPTTAGCHTIQARYVLTVACGIIPAGTAGTGVCATSNIVSVVIFPPAPVITAPANTCTSAFSLPTVTVIAGFDIEYSIDGGPYSSSPNNATPGCHTVQARYVLSIACGTTAAGTTGTGACAASNTVSVVIFPTAPVITAPANTCNSAFALPSVPAVTGFTVQYSINGTAYTATPTIPSAPGCHSITAQYVLTATCGATTAGTAGSGACGVSNTVSTVIFPAAPTAPVVTPGCGLFTVTPPASITGFTIEYSFDDGVTWGGNTPPTTSNCNGYRIKVKYVTSAVCGTTAAGTASTIAGCSESPATIRIVDLIAPTWTTTPGALNVTLQCNDAVGLAAAQALAPAATDNCTGTIAYIKTSGAFVPGSCPQAGTYTNTWIATDVCGNISSVFTQIITIRDDIPPTASNPAPVTVACIADVPAPDPAVVTDEADNCTGPITVTHVGDVSSGTCPIIITRTYRVTDACGNNITVTQTITVQDLVPPTASNPAPVTVACIADVPAPDVTVVTDEADNCTGPITVTHVGDVSSGTCPIIITRTYRVTDACGNNITVTQTITVQDLVPPTASNPAPVTVACIADVPVPDVTVVTDEADNCTGPITVTHVGDVSSGTCPIIITRTYRVTDACGNNITVTQTITVQDLVPPTASNPAPVTVACIADVPAPDPAVVTDEADNCTGPITVVFVSDASSGTCPIIITRTYRVTDACGNNITVTQTITVQDLVPPIISTLPATTTINCPAVPVFETATATDNCSPIVTLSFVDIITPGACAGTYSTARTWTAIDGCGNTAIATQTINVVCQITVTTDTTVCTNQLPFIWHGNPYNLPGIHVDTLINSSGGCDTIATLNLTINQLITITTDTTVCANQLPYIWHGNPLNTAGTYIDTLPSTTGGCDTVATLNLAINPLLTTTVSATVCANDFPATIFGHVFNGPGILIDTVASTTGGCDTARTINVTTAPLLT
ncbi:MAG: immunoglobulin domain-containing protein, partial [Bacteroidetes bacterium]